MNFFFIVITRVHMPQHLSAQVVWESHGATKFHCHVILHPSRLLFSYPNSEIAIDRSLVRTAYTCHQIIADGNIPESLSSIQSRILFQAPGDGLILFVLEFSARQDLSMYSECFLKNITAAIRAQRMDRCIHDDLLWLVTCTSTT